MDDSCDEDAVRPRPIDDEMLLDRQGAYPVEIRVLGPQSEKGCEPVERVVQRRLVPDRLTLSPFTARVPED